jgi:hypothetical protein
LFSDSSRACSCKRMKTKKPKLPLLREHGFFFGLLSNEDREERSDEQSSAARLFLWAVTRITLLLKEKETFLFRTRKELIAK